MAKVASTESLMRFWLKGAHCKPRRPHDKAVLAVYKNDSLLSILPFKLYEKKMTVGELYHISCQLSCFRETAFLDPAALSIALKGLRAVSGKILIRLPFLCPEFSVIYNVENHYIDVGAFSEKDFLTDRAWLARQQKKWPGFQFSFSEFNFSRNRDVVDFYIKNHAKRFEHSRAEVLASLKEIRQYTHRYAAVLRDKTKIAAVWFLSMNSQRELFFWNTAMDENYFLKYAPGNAVSFHLLCYIKTNNLANRVYFGPIYPSTASSYKLKWCDQSSNSYLYLL